MSFHAQGDFLQVLIPGGDEAHAVLFSSYCRVSTRKVGAKNHFSRLGEGMKKGRAPLLGLSMRMQMVLPGLLFGRTVG
jgi:hypothetical protein